MTSKFIIKRNKFIASLVEKYTNPLDSVLDLGCGQGNLIRCMHIPVYYKGVDLNYVGNSHLIENADIMTWETDKKYDTIVLQEVLEHLTFLDSQEITKRIKKFMHDESTLIISVPNFDRLTNIVLGHKYLDDTHKREYIDGYLDTVLEIDEYKIVKKYYFLLYLPFEKYIGWIVPDCIRNIILNRHPNWSSHIVYIAKKSRSV